MKTQLKILLSAFADLIKRVKAKKRSLFHLRKSKQFVPKAKLLLGVEHMRLIYAAILIVSFFYLGWYLDDKLHIDKVVIISELNKIEGIEILKRQNLFFLDNDIISKHIIKTNPAIKSVLVKKIYPNKLEVITELRKPIAQISNVSLPTYIDQEGIVFRTNKMHLSLPQIEPANISLLTGITPDWRIKRLAQILMHFSKIGIGIDRVIIRNEVSVFHFFYQDGIEVLVPFNASAPFTSASLQIIITRFRIEGKKISQVDFRFEKPIVTLNSGEKIYSLLTSE